MSRTLYVYTKKDLIPETVSDLLINTWYDLTKEISEGAGDIHTINLYALYGAQEIFDEIYIDNEIIWPNEKQHITVKEIRYAHNLCKLVGAWYAYPHGDKDKNSFK